MCCFLPPCGNTSRITQATVKTTITHNNFRHCWVSFSPDCKTTFLETAVCDVILSNSKLAGYRKSCNRTSTLQKVSKLYFFTTNYPKHFLHWYHFWGLDHIWFEIIWFKTSQQCIVWAQLGTNFTRKTSILEAENLVSGLT